MCRYTAESCPVEVARVYGVAVWFLPCTSLGTPHSIQQHKFMLLTRFTYYLLNHSSFVFDENNEILFVTSGYVINLDYQFVDK